MALNDALATGRRGKLKRWWDMWVTGGVDHDAVLKQIAEDSGWSGRYAFLIVVSAAISLLGLLMPSVAVLIGAMLLSPLMMPIIGLGFGIATLDFTEIRRSAIALGAGSAVAIVLSVVMVWISPIQTITSEIAGRTQPTLFDLLVALLSAIAGAYALIRGRGGTVVGVAIAIALMPPLAVVGFGIATMNWTVFAGSLLLFLTNAVTIALTAALVARVYGFGSHLSPHHTGFQLALFVATLGILSIPLMSTLREIAFEAMAQRQVRETIRTRFPEGSRFAQLEIDHSVNPMRVNAVMLTPRVEAGAEAALLVDLERRLSRPIELNIDQVQVSSGANSLEAAQIARANNASAASERDRRSRDIADVALIAGVSPAAVRTDDETRVLQATVSPLPGLGLAGYRALELRADRQIARWQVAFVPPSDLAPPELSIAAGVIDNEALDVAAWASARLDRDLLVNGGPATQRRAVADGIVARGGKAQAGEAAGALRLGWAQPLPGNRDERR
jgi:uncharacterized hydrophobic protein (TIGR00271 family)